jgi:transcriptional regulator with XRE-family HTH domain
MKINEVIRKYRKEGNLTQEQVANYLGVTAPAVNKWENGISYPDITLLAPLARVLKTDVDTLLSFHEELTKTEVNQLVKKVSETVLKESYETGFEKGEEILKAYPNCDLLRLYIADILKAYLTIKQIESPEKYESRIVSWYELILSGTDEGNINMATASLVTYYMNKGEYERAQQLLDKIPPIGYDKRLVQAVLYEKQSRNEEAYEVYENMLYKGVNEVSCALQMILHLLCKEKKPEEAERYAGLSKEIGLMFDRGEFNAYMPMFLLAIEKKDKKLGIEILGHLVKGIETLDEYQKSGLYSHIKFKNLNNIEASKKILRDSLIKNKELDFIKNEPEARYLFRMLEGD